MRGLTAGAIALAGLVMAPFLISLADEFMPGTPDWFPYLVVVLFGGILFAVGVQALRYLSAGTVAGALAAAFIMAYAPGRLTWLPVDLRPPF
ncbi:MAG TPA: hypothetical protein VGB83_11165 [Actinomycetota bacterium]